MTINEWERAGVDGARSARSDSERDAIRAEAVWCAAVAIARNKPAWRDAAIRVVAAAVLHRRRRIGERRLAVDTILTVSRIRRRSAASAGASS